MTRRVNGELDKELRLDEAAAAYLEAMESGTAPDRAEWLARYPEVAAELSEFFADQDHLERWTAPLRTVAWSESTPSARLLERTDFVVEKAAVSVASPTAGRCFGDYELLAEIGRGGMGVVYKARQKSLPRLVALKMIRALDLAGPAERQRFQTEAEAAAGLDHPQIIPIYEVGELHGQPYFTMKLVSQGSLADHLEQFGNDLRRAAQLVSQVARAVHHAHQRGILHRDLKPSNILLDAEGRPWVADFGLAKRLDALRGAAGLTHTRTMIGTPAYMAPEQALPRKKAVTVATDVYGLGALLYALLAGRPPFRGESPLDILAQVKDVEPESLRRGARAIDQDLETICRKCLAKEPARRYGSAEAVAADLERWLDGRPIEARPVTRRERLRSWCGRNPLVAGLAGAMALLSVLTVTGLIGSVWWIAGERQTAEEQRDKALELRALAERREAEVRQHLYVNDMKLAKQALLFDNPAFAVATLTAYLPTPGQDDYRGFEWYHLWKQSHPEPQTLRGHSGEVYFVAYSRDGKWLATASQDRTIKLWDPATGREIRTLRGHTEDVNCVAFAPDGQTLASCGDDGTVRFWDLESGAPRSAWGGKIEVAHKGEVTAVEFSPDETLLASAGQDGAVRIWYGATGKLVSTLTGHSGRIESMAFSPRGDLLATAGSSTAKIWKLEWNGSAGALHTEFVGAINSDVGSREVQAVAFAHSGKLLALTCSDGTVKLVDPYAGKEKSRLQFSHRLCSVAFSPDDRHLAACTFSGMIWIATLESGEVRSCPAGTSHRKLWNIRFSASGQQLATVCADKTVQLWNPSDLQARKHLSWAGPSSPVCFLPDGKTFAAGNAYGEVTLWEPGADRPRLRWQLEPYEQRANQHIAALASSPDGKTLAVANGLGHLALIDPQTGRPRVRITGLPETHSVVFSADGTKLLQGAGTGVGCWDAATGNRLPDLSVRRTTSYRLLARPRTKLVAVLDNSLQDATRLWDADNSQWSESEGLPADWPSAFDYSPDGKTLILRGRAEDAIGFFDVTTGRLRTSFMAHCQKRILSVATSPDGRTLASSGSDNTVRLWNMATGMEIYTLEKPPGAVRGLAFSPDGKVLAGTSANGLVVWLTADEPQGTIAASDSAAGRRDGIDPVP